MKLFNCLIIGIGPRETCGWASLKLSTSEMSQILNCRKLAKRALKEEYPDLKPFHIIIINSDYVYDQWEVMSPVVAFVEKDNT